MSRTVQLTANLPINRVRPVQTRTRPPEKSEKLAAVIRDEIVQGEWKPGSRLPTRSDLSARYKVSGGTIQRVFDRLSDVGFIRTNGTNGTFVSEHPPHQFRWGLAFGSHPGSPYWSLFYRQLTELSQRFSHVGPDSIVFYHDINEHEDSEGFEKLHDDLKMRSLAGLILVDIGTSVSDAKLARWRTLGGEIPMVNFMVHREGMPRIQNDNESFYLRAAEHLVGEGRRRIAVLINSTSTNPDRTVELAPIDLIQREFNLEIPNHWRHGIEAERRAWASPIIELIFRNEADRPDGLIVADDNLIESAVTGLLAAQVRVPDDVMVVGHCNFPTNPSSGLPISRLGFSVNDLLSRAIDTLKAIRAGKSVPPVQMNAAVFAEELTSPSTGQLNT